ncbi:MAG: hypothetical protein MGF17_11050 [Trichodesmium sp. MAG_R04]|nr:hypothetical protein [Trichodesmium sp. MAG_R04]
MLEVTSGEICYETEIACGKSWEQFVITYLITEELGLKPRPSRTTF